MSILDKIEVDSNQEEFTTDPDTDKRLDNVEQVEAMTETKQSEIEEILSQIDECAEIETKLESVKEIAQEALDNNKANGGFGEIAHIALTELFGKAGIENSALLPSVESFLDSKTSSYAVGISIEAINVALEDIEESREKARGVVVRSVDELINGVFNTLGQLERRTKDIEADIKNGGLVFGKQGVIKGRLAKKLSVDGKVPTDIAGELKKITEYANVVYEFTKGGLDNVNSELKKNASAIARGEEAPLNIKFPEPAAMKDASIKEIDKVALFGNATRSVMERIKFRTSGPMLGEKSLVIGVPRDFNDLNDIKKVQGVLSWKPWYLGVNLISTSTDKAKEAPALTKEQALKIIAEIKNTFGKIKNLRSTWDKIKWMFIRPDHETAFKMVVTGTKASNRASSALERKKINFISSVFLSDINGLGQYIGYVASSCQAALDLIEQSGQGKAE